MSNMSIICYAIKNSILGCCKCCVTWTSADANATTEDPADTSLLEFWFKENAWGGVLHFMTKCTKEERAQAVEVLTKMFVSVTEGSTIEDTDNSTSSDNASVTSETCLSPDDHVNIKLLSDNEAPLTVNPLSVGLQDFAFDHTPDDVAKYDVMTLQNTEPIDPDQTQEEPNALNRSRSTLSIGVEDTQKNATGDEFVPDQIIHTKQGASPIEQDVVLLDSKQDVPIELDVASLDSKQDAPPIELDVAPTDSKQDAPPIEQDKAPIDLGLSIQEEMAPMLLSRMMTTFDRCALPPLLLLHASVVVA